MFGELEEEVAEEFEAIRARRGFDPGHVFKWSFRQLNADVEIISSLDAAQGGEGTNPKWTVQQRTLVSHLRALRGLWRRLEAKRRLEELKGQKES